MCVSQLRQRLPKGFRNPLRSRTRARRELCAITTSCEKDAERRCGITPRVAAFSHIPSSPNQQKQPHWRLMNTIRSKESQLARCLLTSPHHDRSIEMDAGVFHPRSDCGRARLRRHRRNRNFDRADPVLRFPRARSRDSGDESHEVQSQIGNQSTTPCSDLR